MNINILQKHSQNIKIIQMRLLRDEIITEQIFKIKLGLFNNKNSSFIVIKLIFLKLVEQEQWQKYILERM